MAEARLEEFAARCKALNRDFSTHVQSLLGSAPAAAWEDDLRSYMAHLAHLNEEFADVVTAPQPTPPPSLPPPAPKPLASPPPAPVSATGFNAAPFGAAGGGFGSAGFAGFGSAPLATSFTPFGAPPVSTPAAEEEGASVGRAVW